MANSGWWSLSTGSGWLLMLNQISAGSKGMPISWLQGCWWLTINRTQPWQNDVITDNYMTNQYGYIQSKHANSNGVRMGLFTMNIAKRRVTIIHHLLRGDSPWVNRQNSVNHDPREVPKGQFLVTLVYEGGYHSPSVFFQEILHFARIRTSYLNDRIVGDFDLCYVQPGPLIHRVVSPQPPILSRWWNPMVQLGGCNP